MPKPMPERPDRLRVSGSGRPVGVDREKNVLRGMVVAQAGPFKSEGRGEFDELSLQKIIEAWPKGAGLRSRFAHPNESSDGLGKYLGRARDPYLSTVLLERDGQTVEVPAVRADLYLDASAFSSPSGNLGKYVLDLAESDPAAISSSLVLTSEKEYRTNKDGSPMLDANGNQYPPLWRPKKLYATDVVDEGDAVDGILSANLDSTQPRYTRDYLKQGESLLGQLFANQPRRVVRARLLSYLNRYLDRRYGSDSMGQKNCRCGGNQQLGATLGGLLDDYIEAGASDERPREVIIGQMAETAGISVEEVSAIVQGSDNCPAAEILQAFAQVLGCSLGELVSAAEADGCDYSGAGEEEAPAEAPAPEAAPALEAAPMRSGANPSILRRRLDAKVKNF